MKPAFFKTAADFRRWLEQNHASATELILGFYKKDSGKGGLTYKEAVDEALCFGWIDGIVRRIDEVSHMQRYTPRKRGSIWSNINVGHVQRLIAADKMHPAGLAAYEARTAAKTGIYSFEKPPRKFAAPLEKIFRANRAAWKFWERQPPGYRRTLTHWVVSAKHEETRQRRLARLIAASATSRRLR